MDDLIKLILAKDAQIKEKIKLYSHKRSLYDKIKIGRPFKSILGLRGVGKTTLLVQLAIENDGLYVMLDDLSLSNVNLLELLKKLNKDYGYMNFFIDEIQVLTNYEYYLKDIFEITNFNIVFSGSSLIDILIKNVDLSRRVVNYNISPFSFREYILFKKGVEFEILNYKEILDFEKRKLFLRKVMSYNELFLEYIEYGAYPVMIENNDIINSFKNILEKTFYVDFVKIKNVDQEDINTSFKILKYIAQGTEEISYTNLSNDLKFSKNKIYSLFELLEKSQLVIKVEPKLLGRNLLRKHPKYFMLLPIRNLINKINGFENKIGNLREDFFITSMFYNLSEIRYIKTSTKEPDFFIDNFIFEIGGSGKNKKQIKNYENSYLVKDSLQNDEKIIPLILFGFLY